MGNTGPHAGYLLLVPTVRLPLLPVQTAMRRTGVEQANVLLCWHLLHASDSGRSISYHSSERATAQVTTAQRPRGDAPARDDPRLQFHPGDQRGKRRTRTLLPPNDERHQQSRRTMINSLRTKSNKSTFLPSSAPARTSPYTTRSTTR